jgi:hypothetical protein
MAPAFRRTARATIIALLLPSMIASVATSVGPGVAPFNAVATSAAGTPTPVAAPRPVVPTIIVINLWVVVVGRPQTVPCWPDPRQGCAVRLTPLPLLVEDGREVDVAPAPSIPIQDRAVILDSVQMDKDAEARAVNALIRRSPLREARSSRG